MSRALQLARACIAHKRSHPSLPHHPRISSISFCDFHSHAIVSAGRHAYGSSSLSLAMGHGMVPCVQHPVPSFRPLASVLLEHRRFSSSTNVLRKKRTPNVSQTEKDASVSWSQPSVHIEQPQPVQNDTPASVVNGSAPPLSVVDDDVVGAIRRRLRKETGGAAPPKRTDDIRFNPLAIAGASEVVSSQTSQAPASAPDPPKMGVLQFLAGEIDAPSSDPPFEDPDPSRWLPVPGLPYELAPARAVRFGSRARRRARNRLPQSSLQTEIVTPSASSPSERPLRASMSKPENANVPQTFQAVEPPKAHSRTQKIHEETTASSATDSMKLQIHSETTISSVFKRAEAAKEAAKAAAQEGAETGSVSTMTTRSEPRPRGRPRKLVATAAAHDSVEAGSVSKMAVPSEPRRRGRPRKLVAEVGAKAKDRVEDSASPPPQQTTEAKADPIEAKAEKTHPAPMESKAEPTVFKPQSESNGERTPLAQTVATSSEVQLPSTTEQVSTKKPQSVEKPAAAESPSVADQSRPIVDQQPAKSRLWVSGTINWPNLVADSSPPPAKSDALPAGRIENVPAAPDMRKTSPAANVPTQMASARTVATEQSQQAPHAPTKLSVPPPGRDVTPPSRPSASQSENAADNSLETLFDFSATASHDSSVPPPATDSRRGTTLETILRLDDSEDIDMPLDDGLEIDKLSSTPAVDDRPNTARTPLSGAAEAVAPVSTRDGPLGDFTRGMNDPVFSPELHVPRTDTPSTSSFYEPLGAFAVTPRGIPRAVVRARRVADFTLKREPSRVPSVVRRARTQREPSEVASLSEPSTPVMATFIDSSPQGVKSPDAIMRVGNTAIDPTTFAKSARLSVMQFNKRLMVLAQQKNFTEMLALFLQMQDSQFVKPSIHTYVITMQAFGKAGQLDAMEELYRSLQRSGIGPTTHVYTTIMEPYLEHNRITKVLEAYEDLRRARLVPHPAIADLVMRALARVGDAESAMQMYDLEFRRYPHVVSAVTPEQIIRKFCNEKHIDGALFILRHCLRRKHPITIVAVNEMIEACFQAQRATDAVRVSDLAAEHGVKPVTLTMNLLMRGLMNSEDDLSGPGIALRVYGELLRRFELEPDRHTYNLLLRAHAELDQLDSCYRLLIRMKEAGIIIGETTYALIFGSVNGSQKNVSKVEHLWEHMRFQDRIGPTSFAYQALMRIYIQAGACVKATRIFGAMEVDGVPVTYGTVYLYFRAMEHHPNALVSGTAKSYLADFNALRALDADREALRQKQDQLLYRMPGTIGPPEPGEDEPPKDEKGQPISVSLDTPLDSKEMPELNRVVREMLSYFASQVAAPSRRKAISK